MEKNTLMRRVWAPCGGNLQCTTCRADNSATVECIWANVNVWCALCAFDDCRRETWSTCDELRECIGCWCWLLNGDRLHVWSINITTKRREYPYVFLFPFRLYAFYNPIPCPRKLTFRYNSMLNFIPVSFCFLLLLILGLWLGLMSVIGFRVRVRVRDR